MVKYSWGLVSFCKAKNINIKTAVSLFKKEYGIKADDNFPKFASFVDRKIKSGEIKGDDISLAGDRFKQEAEKRRNYNEQMKSYSKEQLAFWNKIRNERPHYSTMSKFFALHDLYLPQKWESDTELGRNLSRFNILKENNLLEQFLQC